MIRVHRLAYCTNVHAGTTLAETRANLQSYATKVRESANVERLGVGLWLSANASEELIANDGAAALREYCDNAKLDILTLNGFPYGDFHAKVVKHSVYEPSWDNPQRLDYTLSLATCLAALLPETVEEASISTLPLGWRGSVDLDQAAANLQACATALRQLHEDTGKRIHVDLEPEPGCEIDTSQGLVAFFDTHLTRAEHREHIGVCHDICHSAVMFEPQTAALRIYRENGIALGKIQVSSAVEVDFDNVVSPEHAENAYAAFAEERYLHQTVIARDGNTTFHEDLSDAMQCEERSGVWRTHFHVPIFSMGTDLWSSTQTEISR